MSWARMLLMGNIGQQLDIQDVEEDVARMRGRLHAQATTDQSQDEAILALRTEVTELKLVVAELSKLLVASGALPQEGVDRLVRALESPRMIR